MEYIYAAMILHSAEKDINEENVKICGNDFAQCRKRY